MGINKGSDGGREEECSDTVEPQKSKSFSRSAWKKGPEVVLRGEGISDSTPQRRRESSFYFRSEKESCFFAGKLVSVKGVIEDIQ